MQRSEMIRKIHSGDSTFDFIIIGGGATGIGVLLEAVTRGYSALLMEASDFTKSTSSKSTKLVHGGVRYLAQGNIGLVREACVERGYLQKNAPHIVKNLSFIIPVYRFFDEVLYTVGLKIYDLLAGRHSLGRSRRISRSDVLSALSTLMPEKLRAGILYHDGQFDDSRLAIASLQTAVQKGGLAINYMRVKGLIKDTAGSLAGVEAVDELTQEDYKLNAVTIVNATGVFADEIMEMDHPGHKRSIRPSQGIHLVVDKKFLPGEYALMIPKTEDGRVLFAVPWLNKVVLGTTDTPVGNASLEPEALEEEVDFILRTSGKYLHQPPVLEDVLSVFAGLRPLAATEESEKTKEISRSHKILVSDSGLLTMIGGKWTTYRKMAQDLVNKVEKIKKLPTTRSITRKLPLFGYEQNFSGSDPLYLYGSEVEKIKEIGNEPGNSGMLSTKLSISVAQVIYAIRYEMAVSIEDVLARRTRALLLDAEEAKKMAPSVAEIMALEAGHTKHWIENQLSEFYKLADMYIIKNQP
jgi:glycerol-3-phosphate dehydrogenase